MLTIPRFRKGQLAVVMMFLMLPLLSLIALGAARFPLGPGPESSGRGSAGGSRLPP